MAFVPLQPAQHGALGWSPQPNYTFAAGQHLIPAIAAELEALVAHYPLAFIQDDEHFRLMVVTSVFPDHNEYVTPTGKWLGHYKPAFIRAYPFRQMGLPGQPDAQNRKSVLAMEESSFRPVEEATHRLFTGEGTPSDKLKQVAQFCQQIEESRAQLQRAVNALAEHGLIVEWPLQQKRDGKTHAINGLYQIDERALLGLDGDALQSLSALGALSVAYGQLYSRRQFQMFGRLARIKARLAELPADADDGPMSLDELFDEGDDEFNFDFDS